MKNLIFLLFAPMLSSWLGCTSTEPKEVNIPSSETERVKNHDNPPPSKNCRIHMNFNALPTISLADYRPFEREQVKTYGIHEAFGGYFGVYYKNADFDFKPGAGSCSLRYHLTEKAGGEWISVRKQFAQPFDVSECTGVELSITVNQPSENAKLRLTICDAYGNQDEMWWHNFESDVLQKSGEHSFRVPFSDFHLALDNVTRQNDKRLDPTSIIAYEINVLSPYREEANGKIEFSEPRIY